LRSRPSSIGRANTRAWRNALRRAGIKHFRRHDLRHVWATWHVMAGTTMAELQELGAWKSGEMVRRYAHFAPEQLRAAADKLAVSASDGRASDAGLALVAWHRDVVVNAREFSVPYEDRNAAHSPAHQQLSN
jgi:integrase-like protein